MVGPGRRGKKVLGLGVFLLGSHHPTAGEKIDFRKNKTENLEGKYRVRKSEI